MSLNLVPDIWLRLGVERHDGLPSYDDANWSEEDDAFRNVLYRYLSYKLGVPSIPIGGFTQGGASTEKPRI